MDAITLLHSRQRWTLSDLESAAQPQMLVRYVIDKIKISKYVQQPKWAHLRALATFF